MTTLIESGEAPDFMIERLSVVNANPTAAFCAERCCPPEFLGEPRSATSSV
jgi:hypothetical protein